MLAMVPKAQPQRPAFFLGLPFCWLAEKDCAFCFFCRDFSALDICAATVRSARGQGFSSGMRAVACEVTTELPGVSALAHRRMLVLNA